MIDILLVEDDMDYAKSFINFMSKKGFCVTHLNSLDENQLVKEVNKSPKLIILDFFIGNDNSMNTFLFLKKYNIPILYLTSNTYVDDELILLQKGAYDYIDKLKSFDLIYLKLLKVIDINKKEYVFYNNVLNIENKKLNGEINLTNNEYKILLLLIKNLDSYVDKNDLMISLYNDNEFVQTNTITVAIKRLREKIKSHNLNIAIGLEKSKGYYIYEI